MGISINGPSGIDTAYIIDSLVDLESLKVNREESRKDAYQVKIDAYSQFKSLVLDIGKRVAEIQNESDFNIFITSSSDENAVTLSAGTGGVAGEYDIEAAQIAKSEKMVSADGLITDQGAALSTFGITPGKFSINGVEITIDATDTIQDLRSAINSATDGDGNKLDVTATVIKLSDTNFRLVLTAHDTGSAGAAYQDLDGGTVLQALGIIVDAAGDKGNVNQVVQSDGDIASAFAGLGVGDTVTYGGTDSAGNVVANTFVVAATSTIDDLIEQVKSTFHGMVDVTVDGGTGQLTIADRTDGASRLALNSFDIGGVPQAFSTTQVGVAGEGVLSVGKDAFFSVDGLQIQSSSNSAEGYIAGVTLELHKETEAGEAVTLKLERDVDGIVGKIQGMFDAYNAIVRFVKENTKYNKPDEDGNVSGGALAGDMTTRTILGQIRAVFQKQLSLSTTTPYTNLTMVGLETDTQTGEFKLDTDELKEALDDSFDDVISLFVTKGYSDNSSIVMGRFSADTGDGVYMLNEKDADHYEIQRVLPAVGGWEESEARNGEVITFQNGPAAGLMLTAPSGSGGATFTFTKGLAGHLDDLVSKLTDSYEGTFAMRKESWNSSIRRIDDRIVRLEDSIEKFRLRLVAQFSAMEQTMSRLQAQTSSMMSQLGYYSAR